MTLMTRDTHDNYNEILYKIAKLFAELQRILYLCSNNNKEMIIANTELLDAFVQKHAQYAGPLNKWVEKVKSTTWQNHSELKQTFPSADYVKNGRYVFNIGGNNYRVIAVVIFIGGVMNIRFVGTHPEYDKIDSSTI
jgi:mRNA interferase HigB